MNISRGLLAALILALSIIGPASADEHGHRRGVERERREHWGGDIRRFHEHDLGRWRGGSWFHGRHEGRLGWWWIVGGLWYFYPAPVYPYPDPYRPPVVVVPSSPVPPQYWYYCTNPAGYYPYVAQCATPWQPVPATSAPPAPAAPVPGYPR